MDEILLQLSEEYKELMSNLQKLSEQVASKSPEAHKECVELIELVKNQMNVTEEKKDEKV